VREAWQQYWKAGKKKNERRRRDRRLGKEMPCLLVGFGKSRTTRKTTVARHNYRSLLCGCVVCVCVCRLEVEDGLRSKWCFGHPLLMVSCCVLCFTPPKNQSMQPGQTTPKTSKHKPQVLIVVSSPLCPAGTTFGGYKTLGFFQEASTSTPHQQAVTSLYHYLPASPKHPPPLRQWLLRTPIEQKRRASLYNHPSTRANARLRGAADLVLFHSASRPIFLLCQTTRHLPQAAH
jgi:hypothetical protein